MSVKSYRQVPQPSAANEPNAPVELAPGAAKVGTVNIHRASFWLLVVFCGILSLATINLLFFAGQGRRFTAEDGDRDRMERIQTDLALAARIDELHNILAEREAP